MNRVAEMFAFYDSFGIGHRIYLLELDLDLRAIQSHFGVSRCSRENEMKGYTGNGILVMSYCTLT